MVNIKKNHSELHMIITQFYSCNYFVGLCMLSVHRKMVAEKKAELTEEVLNKFAANPRRLIFQ